MTYKTLKYLHELVETKVQEAHESDEYCREQLNKFEERNGLSWQDRGKCENSVSICHDTWKRWQSFIANYEAANIAKNDAETALFEFDSQDWR